MKTTIILFVLGAILFIGCTNDNVRPFISGTYTDDYNHEYGTSNDTLTIEPSEGNNFIIYRKTGLNRIRNGRKQMREFKTETWNAVYDKATKTLTETRKGRLITFFPEANKLMVNSREYQKQ
ncbi:hypothetical protein WG904_17635 [Pedobacter sp. Du54]|uniref:hypothetical protein n=1 Tax=Pedobacter anseongensis TaxID=3133439 RepID=UPI0030B072C9